MLLIIIINNTNTNTNNHNCDDHSLLDFKSAVQYMKHFIYHFTKISCCGNKNEAKSRWTLAAPALWYADDTLIGVQSSCPWSPDTCLGDMVVRMHTVMATSWG